MPRWHDALPLGSVEQSNTLITLLGDTTDRLFTPYQRVMLWDAPGSFEAVQVWQVEADRVRLDVTVNTVQGSWTPGRTLVVPLWPGRLAQELALERPSKRGGRVRLAFDLEAA